MKAESQLSIFWVWNGYQEEGRVPPGSMARAGFCYLSLQGSGSNINKNFLEVQIFLSLEISSSRKVTACPRGLSVRFRVAFTWLSLIFCRLDQLLQGNWQRCADFSKRLQTRNGSILFPIYDGDSIARPACADAQLFR